MISGTARLVTRPMARSAAGLEFSSVASVNLGQVSASSNKGRVLARSELAYVAQGDA